MFQNNPLLAQLKQQLHEKTPRVEGIVKRNNKGFGFLESENKKSYFIPPQCMKKVVNGDRISATVQAQDGKEFVEPDALLQPFLTRFVAKVVVKNDKVSIVPYHPLITDIMACKSQLTQPLKQDDWVMAELTQHPLKDNGGFFATVTDFIAAADDHFAPWLVTLSRNGLEKAPPPESMHYEMTDNDIPRRDYTDLPFTTIDNESTQDMDDALYVEQNDDGNFTLMVAIADPSAYIAEGSELDMIAKTRGYTNYLPGINIPMLPRQLSDELCSLKPHQKRPVLMCKMTVKPTGELAGNAEFSGGWVQSYAKLSYDNVSDFIEGTGEWKPENTVIEQQIRILHQIAELRTQWRSQTTLIFRERPDYRFVLDDKGNVLDIITENRRSANRMIEEAMLAANIALAARLSEQLGYGMFNTHTGFEAASIKQVVAILAENQITETEEALLSLDGYCQFRRKIDAYPTRYIDMRLRRLQSPAEISLKPAPHFGLGLPAYATWTSPIRKYPDLINHRLIKAMITQNPVPCPDESILTLLTERRKANRFAEKNIADWLYADFYQSKVGERFTAEIVDINRGGMRVRFFASGALAFVPSSFIHATKNELEINQDAGTISVTNELKFCLGDMIDVEIKDVRKENQTIIVSPIAQDCVSQ